MHMINKEEKNVTDQKDSYKVLVSAVDLGGAFVDLNCDMGEGMEYDHVLMPFISSANIACGYHAGDEETMKRTVELAAAHHVAVGAHPSFRDRENFGRSEIRCAPAEVYDMVTEQINLLKTITKSVGIALHHVKPHGALYNMAAKDPILAEAVARAIYDVDPGLVMYGLSGSHLIWEARGMGLKTANEVFADRTYRDDGSLTPRSENGAMITDPDVAVSHVLQMVRNGMVTTISGKQIPLVAETICIHGDGANAVTLAQRINQTLKAEDFAIKAL